MTLGSYEQAVSAYVATHLVRATEAGDDGRCAWFRTGAPNEELNGILRLHGERDEVRSTIATGRRRLAGSPALWHVWPGLDPRWLGEELSRSGMMLCETEPLMHASGPSGADANHEAAKVPGAVLEVAGERQLASWATLWSGTSDSAVVGELCAALGQAIELGRTRYLLWQEAPGEEPVACAAVVVADQHAAIEHVVTRRDRRRRGIGAALTAHALMLARRSGASQVVLTASPAGEDMYRRLGFEPLGEVLRYRSYTDG